MIFFNDLNCVNGKSTFYDNDNNVVSNGRVNVYVGDLLHSSFGLDSNGQGTPSIDAGTFYKFEILNSNGEVVSILEPVALCDFGSGSASISALESEKNERIAADSNLQSQINNGVSKDYVDSALGDIRYSIRVNDAAVKEADSKAQSTDDELKSHTSSTSNPHSVTAEQVGAYTKEQVDGFIRNWSGYVVVPFGQSKPAASEAQLGKIYLVQVSNDPEVKDQYEEWISDGTAWSLIGTMSIDLSPYDKIVDAQAREKAINDALAAHKNDAVAHITAAERTKWNGKQDAITIDSAMSSTSTNPVQNKVVNDALNGKLNVYHTLNEIDSSFTWENTCPWQVYLKMANGSTAYFVISEEQKKTADARWGFSNVYITYCMITITKPKSSGAWRTIAYAFPNDGGEAFYMVVKRNTTDTCVWRTILTNYSYLSASKLSGQVAIANGGTGASSAAQALTNLGITFTTADEITEILGGLE